MRARQLTVPGDLGRSLHALDLDDPLVSRNEVEAVIGELDVVREVEDETFDRTGGADAELGLGVANALDLQREGRLGGEREELVPVTRV